MTPAADDDIQAYLDRLLLDREPPSAEALFRVHRAQLELVPYETTWIHLGERWGVDRHESLRRIAHLQRGGYCFHLNGALSLLLESLGYEVSLHVGGVHGPDGVTAERMYNHLVLQVHGLPTTANPTGTWYVDAGLGDALHEPLPLDSGTYQQGPFEFELVPADAPIADWQFRHHPLGSFAGMAFRSSPCAIEDFAAMNTHLSTSPDSGFVTTLTAQRRDASGVDSIRGQILRRVEATVTAERTLSTRGEWFDALADVFHLGLADIDDDGRDRLWRRVQATHQQWLGSTADPPGHAPPRGSAAQRTEASDTESGCGATEGR